MRKRKDPSLFWVWYALFYRQFFAPKHRTLWMRGADGEWHDADDWTRIHVR